MTDFIPTLKIMISPSYLVLWGKLISLLLGRML